MTQVRDVLVEIRDRLVEPLPRFWSDAELIRLVAKGAKELWRSIVDLKQEHFLKINTTDVTFPASSDRLAGVPPDVHKVYMIEARDLSINSADRGLLFKPLDYNHDRFQMARSIDPVEPENTVVYYCITSQGGPVNSPTILCAPQVTSAVEVAFAYVPVLDPIETADALIPIPGEADAAIIAYAVAYARAKERDDRSPDPAWLATYSAEKQGLLQSLGMREYQEPTLVDGLFADYW